MTVKARNRTPAALARQQPAPAPTFTQGELRERRRQGLGSHLRGGWSLTVETCDICVSLANRVAERGAPRTYIRYVEDLADAAGELIFVASGLVAEAKAQNQTRHLSLEERGRAMAAVRTLVQRPQLPEIDAESVAEGLWGHRLAAAAAMYDHDLDRLLGNALTGVVSERLLRALAGVDHAARALERRLDRDDQPRSRRAQDITAADHARAELAKLGISL
ncbi:hypothetical protein [Mycobacterium sp. AT1]|uniref:hypothetical protein n=1 Tax=Mycobacterium sp. AT1 TaxID=1961706 RepID=UPI0009AEEB84|nr:hypothetical protein [Mycobacterium sp. AT1]OPX12484.1 hypothetical protein B1790_03270 [Mycobacterium sp. AT1]